MLLFKRILKFSFVALLLVGSTDLGQTVHASSVPKITKSRFVIATPTKTPRGLARVTKWLAAHDFDIAGSNWRRGTVEVVTTQKGIKFLKAQGYKGYVVAEGPGSRAPDRRFLNPQTVEEKLKAINQAYPKLTRLEQIGKSNEGRPIWALLISTTPGLRDPRNLEKPSILFDGLHHAREVMTPEVVLDVAETTLKGLRRSPRLRQVVDRWQIWVVPMINVDGSNIVWTSDNMWRKNARADKGDVHGVDINRNYSYLWDSCNGSSSSQNSEVYHGTSPGSEPETQALMGLADRIRPTASLSYHSFSELVLYSLGCSEEIADDKNLIIKIGQELAQRLPTDDGRAFYTPGTPWQLLYDVDGSSMDHMYGAYGTLAYTFEVNTEFQPSYDLREPTLKKHRLAWGYFMTRIDQNLLTLTVVDQKTGRPVEAAVKIDRFTHPHGELPFQTNKAGKFFKVLDPGKYQIAAKLPDGRTSEVTVSMNGQPEAITLTVQ